MNDDTILTDSFRRLIADLVTPARVRAFEERPALDPVWAPLVESGFLDALVAEDKGGAGLSLSDVYPLISVLGEYAVSVPFGETMVARALLAAEGFGAPDGAAIIIAPPSPIYPFAAVATHALVQEDDAITLIGITGAVEDPFRIGGASGFGRGATLARFSAPDIDLNIWAAGLAAVQMSGAMARMLEMTLRHANERQQFGRPLGKFQAIQQQLAVMAAQVVSAQIAARTGMSGARFDLARVAAAKCRVNEAAHQVTAIAHAVHGAMGVTAEFDLQLYSRRIKQWQLAFGSETFWAERLGRVHVAAARETSADFVREFLVDAGA